MLRLGLPSLIALLICMTSAYTRVIYPLVVQTSQTASAVQDGVKVPVVLGVMSGCPDSLLCEAIFDHVLQRVADKVDLSLTFVATLNNTEPEFGVTCKHGPQECAGNVQELCAMKYAPFRRWWEFVQCQNFQGRYEVGKPETALRCANSAQLDWENSGVGACAGLSGDGKGTEGISLLRENVIVTAEMGIRRACTMIINGKQVCIHDDTWKECEGGHTPADFIRQIEEEYAKLNDA